MTEPRNATIQIIEYGAHTAINVSANEKVNFSLTLSPKKFDDPELLDLRKVVDNQREEITKALEDAANLSAMNDSLAAELAEAKKAIRNGNRTRRPSRKR